MITHRQAVRAVKKWQKVLHLEDWTLTVIVAPQNDCEACCLASPEYRAAKIMFDPVKVAPDELDTYAKHEMIHCVVWPLASVAHTLAKDDAVALEWVRQAEEGLTTALEAILK